MPRPCPDTREPWSGRPRETKGVAVSKSMSMAFSITKVTTTYPVVTTVPLPESRLGICNGSALLSPQGNEYAAQSVIVMLTYRARSDEDGTAFESVIVQHRAR